MKRLLSTVAAVFIIFVPVAEAHDKGSIQHKNKYLRAKVIKKHDKRAPGRNIVKYGLRNGKKPSYKKIHTYFEQLRQLAAPRQYLAVAAVPPAQQPAGTQTAHVSATGLASCIISRESGGDPQAVNPNGHYGIGQWDMPTWRAHGGTKYAGSPLGASKQQQLEILNSALSRYGCSAWCPYDGC